MNCALAIVSVAASLCGCLGTPARPIGDGGGGSDTGGTDVPASSIRVVQATTRSSQAGVTSVIADFADPPTAGDTIVLYAWSLSSLQTLPAASGFADSEGNIYQRAIGHMTSSGSCYSGSGALGIYYASPIAASSNPVHVTYTVGGGGPQEVVAVAVEYSGFAHTPPTLSMTSADTSAAPTPATWSSGSIAVSGPALLAAVGESCNANTTSITDNAGFTPRAVEIDWMNHPPGIAADKIVSAAGSYDDSWTVAFTDGANQPELGAIAGFE